MSDWQVGDVAWCVSDCMEEHCPKVGSAYEVVGLCFHENGFGEKVLGLDLDRGPWEFIWNERFFVKVTPEKSDLYDAGIISLMSRKPVEV